MNKKLKALVILAVLFGFALTATGFINPNFTPVDLVNQSGIILLLDFQKPDKEGKAIAKVKKVLKGKYDKKTVVVELLAMPEAFAAQGQLAINYIEQGHKQALMFIGMFEGEGAGGEPGEEEVKAWLHLSHKWFLCWGFEEGVWDVAKREAFMLGTWAGSNDMLLRCVNYILSDPDAEVPVNSGREWGEAIRIGRLEGPPLGEHGAALRRAQDGGVVSWSSGGAARPVDVTGKGRADLYLAGEAGDRIFRWTGRTLEDVTARHALRARSLASAWGDFDGDGTLDLASWNGETLSFHFQKADGSFRTEDAGAGDALGNGCVALATLDCGRLGNGRGRPALLASTRASPVLLIPGEDGGVSARPLVAGVFPGKGLGPAGPCFVVDFDKDDVPDILQPFERGSLFYKGRTPGTFAAPVRSRMYAGRGPRGAALGDFDADGKLDIFIAGPARAYLWHNLGGGDFVELLHMSGEIEYITKPGGVDVRTGDVNNDGRQDVLVVYGAEQVPQLFFNRGFRSFGHARVLDITAGLRGGGQAGARPSRAVGEQLCGSLGDFTGDGAQDFVLLFADGELWMFPGKVEEDGALSLTAALSLRSPTAGPVNVSAWDGSRPLGVYAVRPGEPGAFWGKQEAGPITLRWRLPGGRLREKEVIVEEGPVRVLLDEQ